MSGNELPPPWVGAVLEGGWVVCGFDGLGCPIIAYRGRLADDPLDLTHPDTFHGCLVRLALAMGAPAGVVVEGVVFAPRWSLPWLLASGYRGACGDVPCEDDFAWGRRLDYLCDVTEPALALRTACAAHVNLGGEWLPEDEVQRRLREVLGG